MKKFIVLLLSLLSIQCVIPSNGIDIGGYHFKVTPVTNTVYSFELESQAGELWQYSNRVDFHKEVTFDDIENNKKFLQDLEKHTQSYLLKCFSQKARRNHDKLVKEMSSEVQRFYQKHDASIDDVYQTHNASIAMNILKVFVRSSAAEKALFKRVEYLLTCNEDEEERRILLINNPALQEVL